MAVSYTHLDVYKRQMLQLTIKINKTDVQALVATFERYNYTIVEVFAAESYHEDLKENYDSLMQYLDI